MEMLIILFVAIIGACLGSFVTAASYRLPRNEDIVFAPSHCPNCDYKLKPRDLFPIFSWVLSRAKCRGCKAKISARYVITEIVTMLIAVGLFLKFGVTPQFLLFLLLSTAMMVLVVADFETYIIPDSTTVSALILGVIYVYFYQPEWGNNIIGAVAGLLVAFAMRWGYRLIKKQEGLGMGDVKFLPVAGLWVGFELLPLYFVFAGLLGMLTALVWKIAFKNPVFPFGPALAAAMVLICVFKDAVETLMRMYI